MATLLSPGVAWSEVDLTTVVPSLSTTVGGFAGNFVWGPVNELTRLSNEIELVNTFGQPDQNTFTSFYTAANFLSYAQNLLVVRACDTTEANNAVSGSQPLVIENNNIYENEYMNLSAAANTGMFAARYPGAVGNGLKVSLWASANSTAFSSWTYAPNFNGVPGTTNWTTSRRGANDEMHIIVIDTLGNFSGTPNTVLERFSYVSKAIDATNDDGTSNYYINVINDRSKYVYILHHAQMANGSADTTTWGSTAANTTFAEGNTNYTATLAGGTNGAPTSGDLTDAYDLFNDAEKADVSLLMTGDASQTVSEYIVDNIAEGRKDLVAFISPPQAAVVNNIGSEATAIITNRNLFNSTSYAVMDSGWKKQFDKYNNVYRWVPLNGDIAGLCARTDYTNDAWWSPAGLNRGLIKNVTQLSWSPNQADRDTLYKNSVNPVVSMSGVGTVFYGDKTMTSKPSAFDRINVRRLFIVLEQSISRAAKYSLFEFNDEFTRAQFVALVDPFLRDIKGKRGIFDYQVVCDTTNNTPEVIDKNEFVGDIYIKPARAINFIQLNFVAVGTGVAFSEIVGKTGV
jgi:hypothetical protein